MSKLRIECSCGDVFEDAEFGSAESLFRQHVLLMERYGKHVRIVRIRKEETKREENESKAN